MKSASFRTLIFVLSLRDDDAHLSGRYDRSSVDHRTDCRKWSTAEASICGVSGLIFSQRFERILQGFLIFCEVDELYDVFVETIRSNFIELAEGSSKSRERFLNFGKGICSETSVDNDGGGQGNWIDS